MDGFILRTPHIAKQIFEQIDNKSLRKCREVKRSWMNCIEEKNIPWIRIVRIPKFLEKNDTYFCIAGKYGQSEVFKNIPKNAEILNSTNRAGRTPFHLVCEYGYFKIAKMLIDKYDFMIGEKGLRLAWKNNHSNIVELIIKNSENITL